jgi:hypothetical protein
MFSHALFCRSCYQPPSACARLLLLLQGLLLSIGGYSGTGADGEAEPLRMSDQVAVMDISSGK